MSKRAKIFLWITAIGFIIFIIGGYLYSVNDIENYIPAAMCIAVLILGGMWVLYFFGYLTESIGDKKGFSNGFVLGFILNILGVLIVLLSKDNSAMRMIELKNLLEEEIITKDEYKEKMKKLSK